MWAVYGQGTCLGKYRILTDKQCLFKCTVNLLKHSLLRQCEASNCTFAVRVQTWGQGCIMSTLFTACTSCLVCFFRDNPLFFGFDNFRENTKKTNRSKWNRLGLNMGK